MISLSSKVTQLNSDDLNETAFVMKTLHRKTPYNNILVKIFSIKMLAFDFCATVIVAGFQSVVQRSGHPLVPLFTERIKSMPYSMLIRIGFYGKCCTNWYVSLRDHN